jgi:hypothetical protein
VKVSPETLATIDAIADQEVRSRSNVIAVLVAEGLRRRKAAEKEAN